MVENDPCRVCGNTNYIIPLEYDGAGPLCNVECVTTFEVNLMYEAGIIDKIRGLRQRKEAGERVDDQIAELEKELFELSN